MRALLTWLDQHAGAVQAVAALITAGLTAVLVHVTRTYVRLTRQLALAATAEQQRREAEARGLRAAFSALVTRLRQTVPSLPTEGRRQTADRDIRAAVLWTDDDLHELAHLGAIIAPEAALEMARLIDDLNWLAARAGHVRRIDPKVGYDWKGPA